MRSFVEKKILADGEITLSFTDEDKLCHSGDFYVANMSFNAFRENKILAKICDFIVKQIPLRANNLGYLGM